MAFFIFSGGADSWSGTGFTWVGDDGDPDLGCLNKHDAATFSTALVSITGLSINVSGASWYLEFRCKYAGSLTTLPSLGSISIVAKNAGGTTLGGVTFVAGNPGVSSGVWMTGGINFLGTANGPITTLEMLVSGSSNVLTDVWFDSVYVAELPPAGPVIPDAKRYLGMAADNENIYLTSVLSGTLAFQYYQLSDLTTLAGSAVFGASTYTDPDTFTNGIYPVLRPGSDKVLYLRGRDIGGIQLWHNDLNGTLGWLDVGAGISAWDASKFVVALMPWPATPNGVLVAFSDGEIYQTLMGTTDWTIAGSATTELRTAIRSDFEGHKLLLGGTTIGGTVQFTQNKGVSFDSGGTVAGTIHAIEWSYTNA